jgi:hypothetical protein
MQNLDCVIPSHRFQWRPTSDQYYRNVAHGAMRGDGWVHAEEGAGTSHHQLLVGMVSSHPSRRLEYLAAVAGLSDVYFFLVSVVRGSMAH